MRRCNKDVCLYSFSGTVHVNEQYRIPLKFSQADYKRMFLGASERLYENHCYVTCCWRFTVTGNEPTILNEIPRGHPHERRKQRTASYQFFFPFAVYRPNYPLSQRSS